MLTQRDTPNISVNLTESLWKAIYNLQIFNRNPITKPGEAVFLSSEAFAPDWGAEPGPLVAAHAPRRAWQPPEGSHAGMGCHGCQGAVPAPGTWLASRACLHGCAEACWSNHRSGKYTFSPRVDCLGQSYGGFNSLCSHLPHLSKLKFHILFWIERFGRILKTFNSSLILLLQLIQTNSPQNLFADKPYICILKFINNTELNAQRSVENAMIHHWLSTYIHVQKH